ncbi:hypothetical protein SMC26_40690 [Actinomadura fulvescens]|uniref:Membrane transporter protein n=1 Tax=Actinomadura fulvescens TaxID=46160 RepID=A0ABN3QYY0_9ACTN
MGPALLIGCGTPLGGWLGALVGQRLSPALLRGLIAATGLASVTYLLS